MGARETVAELVGGTVASGCGGEVAAVNVHPVARLMLIEGNGSTVCRRQQFGVNDSRYSG